MTTAADQFCSWCGCSLFQVDCSVSPELVYFHPAEGGLPAISVLLQNNGLLPVTVLDVLSNPPGYVHFPHLPLASNAGETAPAKSARPAIVLQAGEVRELQGKITPAALRDFEGAHIRLKPKLDPAVAVAECRVAVLPFPEFELLTPALQLFDTLSSQSPMLRCSSGARIRLRHGRADIRELACDQPGVIFLPDGPHPIPTELEAEKNNGTLSFQVEVERAFLAPYLRTGQPMLATLKLVCNNPPGTFAPFNSPLKIFAHPVPRLEFPDLASSVNGNPLELQTWALTGRTRTLSLQIKNPGTLSLEIFAIKTTATLECLALQGPDLPITLLPKQSADVQFLLDTRTIADAQEITGKLTFQFRAGQETEFTARLALAIDVRQPQPYPGVSALDFGASHTCLAVAELDDKPESMPRLVRIAGEAFVPSAIMYHDISPEGERHYDIGHAALVASAGVDAVMHVIPDLRKHLGVEHDWEIILHHSGAAATLPAPVILTDFIKKFISEAENSLADELYRRAESGLDFSACLLQNTLVTHPATFTDHQKRALCAVLANAGFNSPDETWLQPAPVVAGFEGLVARVPHWQAEAENATQPQLHHVLTYDLGASATGLALTRIELQPEANKTFAESTAVIMNLKTLSVDGDPGFGGDTITVALAKYLMEQAVAQLEQKLEPPVVVPLWNRALEQPQLKLEKIGYLNWRRLLRNAEHVKCLLSESPPDKNCSFKPMTLQVVTDGKVKAATITGVSANNELLHSLVEAHLDEHVQMLKSLVRKHGLECPEIFRLTGKSTLLPFIRARFADIFNPRKCRVVYSLDGKPAKTLLPINGLKSTAAVGGVHYLCHLKRGNWAPRQEPLPQQTGMRIGLGIRGNNSLRFWEVIGKGGLIGAEYVVRPFGLTLETTLTFYASAKEGEIHLPQEAQLIAACRLNRFMPALPGDLRDEELLRLVCAGKLRVQLTPNHELHVLLQARGREYVIYLTLQK